MITNCSKPVRIDKHLILSRLKRTNAKCLPPFRATWIVNFPCRNFKVTRSKSKIYFLYKLHKQFSSELRFFYKVFLLGGINTSFMPSKYLYDYKEWQNLSWNIQWLSQQFQKEFFQKFLLVGGSWNISKKTLQVHSYFNGIIYVLDFNS